MRFFLHRFFFFFFFDIGALDFIRRFSLPDSQKLDALTSRFPSKGWKAPSRDFGKTSRRVTDFVFDESLYPFYKYSHSLDVVFCAPCTIFSQASVTGRQDNNLYILYHCAYSSNRD